MLTDASSKMGTMAVMATLKNKQKNEQKSKQKSKPTTFIVIPTIRELTFLEDWREQFDRPDIALIVCEDRPSKSVSVPKIGSAQYHYSWKEIDADLGKDSWIIPRKVSAIRNYGFLKAYELSAKYILTLDDDCYPVKGHNWVDLHVANLSLSAPARWTNTNPDARHMYTRGMPYLSRVEQPVMLSHGVWTNVLDHDAPTHLQTLQFRAQFAEHFLQIIPNGAYFPLCSMNFAFRAELTPLMYFPLMGENAFGEKWGFDRFDDIWAGIFAKKVMDHLGLGVVNGAPMVEHRKASDPFVNLQKEAAGITVNEVLWQAVDRVELGGKTVVECYAELAGKIDFEWVVGEARFVGPTKEAITYFKKLKEAMVNWANLLDSCNK